MRKLNIRRGEAGGFTGGEMMFDLHVEWSKEDGEYVATCPAFPGLSALGSTEAAALAEGKVALKLFIQSCLEDPSHELNGPKYKTGKKCIEPDCMNPAGTYWSPYWCFFCNVKRMTQVTSK